MKVYLVIMQSKVGEQYSIVDIYDSNNAAKNRVKKLQKENSNSIFIISREVKS